jgi:O-succinylbenzoic acid--CoA ligase
VWHGREDFVINSGGYKIFPEKLEKDLQAYFSERGIVLNGVLIGIPDDVLGEKCVLIIEESCQAREEDIFEFARRNFHPYEVPKAIVKVSSFPLTATGKTDRKAVKNVIAADC